MDQPEEEPKSRLLDSRFDPSISNWGPIAAILVTLGSFLFSGVLYGIVETIINGPDALQDDNLEISWYFALILGVGMMLPVILFVARRQGSLAAVPRALGLRAVPIALGAKLLAITFGLLFLIQFIAGMFLPAGEQSIADSIRSAPALPMFISVAIIVPIYEEVLFRGLLFAGMRQRWSFLPAAALSGIIFTIAHFEGGLANIIALSASILLSAIAFAWLYEKSNSLWPAITLHSLSNGLAFLLLVYG